MLDTFSVHMAPCSLTVQPTCMQAAAADPVINDICQVLEHMGFSPGKGCVIADGQAVLDIAVLVGDPLVQVCWRQQCSHVRFCCSLSATQPCDMPLCTAMAKLAGTPACSCLRSKVKSGVQHEGIL